MKISYTFLLLLFTCTSWSQDKVTWNSSYDSSQSEVIIHANIEEGWHLYSQFLESDLGPIPTEIVFEKNKNVIFSEKTNEPAPKVSYDQNFGGDLSYFESEVKFTNKIEVKNPTFVKGFIVYMICSDEMCLPPTEEKFEIEIK